MLCNLSLLQMRWNVKGYPQDFSNKEIVPIATSVPIFQYKNARKTSFLEFQKILYNWSISITTKANLRRKSLI